MICGPFNCGIRGAIASKVVWIIVVREMLFYEDCCLLTSVLWYFINVIAGYESFLSHQLFDFLGFTCFLRKLSVSSLTSYMISAE